MLAGLLDGGGVVGNDSDVADEVQLAPMRERSPGGSAPLEREYGAPVVHRNGIGRAAMAFGLAALVLCLVPGLGLALSVLAFVLGVVGSRRARRLEATNPRQAQLGLFLGAVAGVVAVITSVAVIVLWPQLSEYRRCVQNATTDTDQQTCSQQFRHAVDRRFP